MPSVGASTDSARRDRDVLRDRRQPGRRLELRSSARPSAIANVDADAQRFFGFGASAFASTASTASEMPGRSCDGGVSGSLSWRCTTCGAGPEPNGGRPVSAQYIVAARP